MKKTVCGKKKLKSCRCVEEAHNFLQALSNVSRLKILSILQNGPKCVCEIVSEIGISDKLASHHLKKLREAGLLEEERDGNFIRYNLDGKGIEKGKKFLSGIIK
jgi:ArsR family transcriptional regulator